MKFKITVVLVLAVSFALGFAVRYLTCTRYCIQDDEFQVFSSKETDGSIVVAAARNLGSLFTVVVEGDSYKLVPNCGNSVNMQVIYEPEAVFKYAQIGFNSSLYEDNRKPFAMLMSGKSRGGEYDFIYGWRKTYGTANSYFEVLDKGFFCNLSTLLDLELSSGKQKEIGYIMLDKSYMKVDNIGADFDSATRATDDGTEVYQLIDGKWIALSKNS